MIKVLDFGVSKALSTDIRAEGTVTTTDAVFGSPLYMSPEQMQSASKADERSDIWSLGVVLYELLTRRMPFDAESMAGLAVRIATDPPTRLVEALPGAPLALEGVVFKCLGEEAGRSLSERRGARGGSRAVRARESRRASSAFNASCSGRRFRRAPCRPRRRCASSRCGAETLGPLDAGEHSSAVGVAAPEKKRRAWPIVAGIVVVSACALAAAMFVRQQHARARRTPRRLRASATLAAAHVRGDDRRARRRLSACRGAERGSVGFVATRPHVHTNAARATHAPTARSERERANGYLS